MGKEVIMRVSCEIRICMLVAVWIGCPSLLSGQSPADVRDRINAIKLDEKYLYAEVTHQDPNWAYENALAELLLAVNECRGANGKGPLEVSDLTVRVKQLTYKRGEKSVVFVYMQIDKALTVSRGKSRNIVIGQAAPKASAVNKMEAEEHRPTVIKEPPVEQEEPKVVKQPPVDSKPLDADLVALSTDEIARVILRIEMVTDIGGFMEEFKAKGKVASYGVARSMEEIYDDAYLILYDRTFSIRTVLSPSLHGKRLNLRTNEEDAASNYRGCGVYWYKIIKQNNR